MANLVKTCVPLPLENEEELKELVQKGKDWALLHGVGMRCKEHFSPESITFTPFTLFPSTFPEEEFRKSTNIQPILNELMHKVAYDDQFLRKCLLEVCDVDPYILRLVQLYQEVLTEGPSQKLSLGLFRSDYMIDSPSGQIKQIEFNTIASSFGALTSILPNWHSYALASMGPEYKEKVSNIPPSHTLTGYVEAILEARSLYNTKIGTKNSAILIVVEDKSVNIADQRFIEFEIQKKDPQVRVIRKTLTEIGTQLTRGDRRRLFINGVEIAVVYYRAGYAPDFYHSELEWQARVQMERSKAIKCPSVQYQLAGSKKVQQELARPGVLEQFLTPEQAAAVRPVFTGLYSMDMNDPNSDEIIRKAIADPSSYVLKPQREGGGNNLYDEDLSEHLKKIQHSEERHAWILMDKINAPSQKNYFVRPGHEALFADSVSELGVFGVIIGNGENILLNKGVGHMLRAKESTSKEGGIMMGTGVLDSLYLTST